MGLFESVPPLIKIILIVAGAVAFISIISSVISGMNKSYGNCQNVSIEVGQINNKDGICYSVNKATLRMALTNTGSSPIHSFIYVSDGETREELIIPRSSLNVGKSTELNAQFARDKNPTVRLIPRVETESGVISCEDKSIFKVNVINC
ncbi:hypothetical protein COV13_02975 [Candidatus Woesearchaeota archaeon CG10_big_fil_rev_8_21_14_0_10_32_9]|nr:MAG: hypothetical protein COV13_02975 [Candidatus Woesearchaeota archaeon CG10_big_fil_rev_8_21_14_0_10_32_9]